MGSPSGHALRAAAAGVDCILRPKARRGCPERLEPPEWTPGRHLSVQQLPRVTWQPRERRAEARRKPRDATRLGESAVAGRSGRGDYVLSDLSVLLFA